MVFRLQVDDFREGRAGRFQITGLHLGPTERNARRVIGGVTLQPVATDRDRVLETALLIVVAWLLYQVPLPDTA